MRRRISLDELLESPPAEPSASPAEVATSRAQPRHTRQDQGLVTEFGFELPRGYVDAEGTVHHNGTMRLATARDELLPQTDLWVKENPAYLSVVLLSLVITRLGTVTDVHTGVVESMYATDVAFLQDFYQRINSEGHTRAAVSCPHCDGSFEVDLSGGRLGES
jgi:hypothetical protein